MAHRKRKKTHRRKGHRMSGTGGAAKMLVNVGLGMLGQKIASGVLQKVAPTTFTPLIANLATGAVGMVVVPKIIKGPAGMAIGVGAAGMGAVSAIATFGLLPGILSGTGDGQVFRVQLPGKVAGYNGSSQIPTIGRFNGSSQIPTVGNAKGSHIRRRTPYGRAM